MVKLFMLVKWKERGDTLHFSESQLISLANDVTFELQFSDL